jgi:hypothetical protein
MAWGKYSVTLLNGDKADRESLGVRDKQKFAQPSLQEALQIGQPARDETRRRWGHHPRRHSWSRTRTGLFMLLGFENFTVRFW